MERGTVGGVKQARFVAGKSWSDGKKRYSAGDPVDISALPPHKVEQFLRQRLLVPAPVREK